jgi:hypothetical protein
MKRALSVIATSSVLVGVLTACAAPAPEQGSGMHVSRAAIYGSVDELLADATDVVVVKVESAKVEEPAEQRDGSMTLVTASVEDTVARADMGRNRAEAGYNVGSIEPGDSIVIRQHGESGLDGAPTPFLEPGEEYLLFLNPASPEGEAAAHFTVVGIDAGIYVHSEDDQFSWIASDPKFQDEHAGGPVDDLPELLSADDLR